MDAPDFEASDLAGERWALSEELNAGPLLLCFLRYASCPMCLLRLDELAREAPALHASGLGVAVVLHSTRERIRRHARRNLPFRVIPDPSRRLYRLYRVETSWLGVLLSMARPSFYTRWIQATMRGYLGGAVDGEFARMPADFVIAADGTIARVHYGTGIGDHLRLDGLTAGFIKTLARTG